MDIQSLLTFAIVAIVCSFVTVLTFDFGERISGELFDIFSPAATKTNLRMHSICATTVQLSALGAESPELVPPLALFTPVVEDPWSVEVELTTPTCCCHPAILRIAPEKLSLTAIATPPQLLLAPALVGAEQPDLATMPSSQLRKLCSERGIKWRGVHGGKHLSKPDMVAALGG